MLFEESAGNRYLELAFPEAGYGDCRDIRERGQARFPSDWHTCPEQKGGRSPAIADGGDGVCPVKMADGRGLALFGKVVDGGYFSAQVVDEAVGRAGFSHCCHGAGIVVLRAA